MPYLSGQPKSGKISNNGSQRPISLKPRQKKPIDPPKDGIKNLKYDESAVSNLTPAKEITNNSPVHVQSSGKELPQEKHVDSRGGEIRQDTTGAQPLPHSGQSKTKEEPIAPSPYREATPEEAEYLKKYAGGISRQELIEQYLKVIAEKDHKSEDLTPAKETTNKSPVHVQSSGKELPPEKYTDSKGGEIQQDTPGAQPRQENTPQQDMEKPILSDTKEGKKDTPDSNPSGPSPQKIDTSIPDIALRSMYPNLPLEEARKSYTESIERHLKAQAKINAVKASQTDKVSQPKTMTQDLSPTDRTPEKSSVHVENSGEETPQVEPTHLDGKIQQDTPESKPLHLSSPLEVKTPPDNTPFSTPLGSPKKMQEEIPQQEIEKSILSDDK